MMNSDRVMDSCRRMVPLCLLAFLPFCGGAQQLLSLDSCRVMALRNNKQLAVSRLKQDVARNLRKSARAKYLPHVSAIGTYQHTSEELSLLNNEQKDRLSNLGTNTAGGLQGMGQGMETTMGQFTQLMAQMGVPAEALQQMAGNLQQQFGQTMAGMTGMLNNEGQGIVDAFRTDTRNVWAGSLMVTQPLFLGGAIVALNRIADINEDMMCNSAEARQQTVVYDTDQAYWQVVSLKHKQKLANSYLELIRKLDGDVQKMIEEGVATRSEGLSVSVKVNAAEMAVQKVDDGLRLSRMLLCKIIGLPLNTDITLADEESATPLATMDALGTTDDLVTQAQTNRPELKMLQNTVDITRQTTNILKAGNLPQMALTGGYAVSNPNVLNGFEKKFGGFWNIGVLLRIPIWNWGDVANKVRASKGATAIANLELEEARDLVELQVNQTSLKIGEASKHLALAMKSIEQAEENLRTANLGFQEGVITPTVVMEAQTAWLQAQSQKIDAEIEMKLAQVDMQKALGTLTHNPN